MCNNNDYQNIGVNGASSGDLNKFSNILSRDNLISTLPQKPVLLFMAMIGNDVCTHDSIPRNTPEQYKQNFKETVLSLETRLPKGSKIITVGLVDGRILYESMHNRVHPLGSTNQDVTFGTFYDYLNCLELSPCAGWMNSNQTIRDATSATAAAMRNTLPEVIAETKDQLQNIEVHYLGDLIDDAINFFLAEGHQGHELIEESDGFHPNQVGQAMIAQFIWNATVNAGIIPAANPNNEKIREKFFANEGQDQMRIEFF